MAGSKQRSGENTFLLESWEGADAGPVIEGVRRQDFLASVCPCSAKMIGFQAWKARGSATADSDSALSHRKIDVSMCVWIGAWCKSVSKLKLCTGVLQTQNDSWLECTP